MTERSMFMILIKFFYLLCRHSYIWIYVPGNFQNFRNQHNIYNIYIWILIFAQIWETLIVVSIWWWSNKNNFKTTERNDLNFYCWHYLECANLAFFRKLTLGNTFSSFAKLDNTKKAENFRWRKCYILIRNFLL